MESNRNHDGNHESDIEWNGTMAGNPTMRCKSRGGESIQNSMQIERRGSRGRGWGSANVMHKLIDHTHTPTHTRTTKTMNAQCMRRL